MKLEVKFDMFLICFAAFSAFALCEYIVALANMAFHVTVILDFPEEHLVVAKGLKNPVLCEGKVD